MSYELPSVKHQPTQPAKFDMQEGPYMVPDLMTTGLGSARAQLESAHPLHQSELNHGKKIEQMNMSILRNTQGLHAPLRLAMELKSAKKVGRLPFLPSSNIMHDVLTGRDSYIGPEDVFNTSEFLEMGGQPHAVIERSLGIL